MRTLFRNLRTQRSLLFQLWARDYAARYKGGMLGVFWAVLNPLMMLALYSFVFVVVFKMRWQSGPDVSGNFVILLFTGLIVHAVFADFITRAPTLITSQAVYVKKVIFPLEFLPLLPLSGALINFTVALGLVVALILIMQGFVPPTIVFVPIIMAPYVLITIGITYFVSSIGVYIRDLSQFVGIWATIALFASPVLYPMENVPAAYRPVLYSNPLTFPVEQLRQVAVIGSAPDWLGLCVYSAVAIFVFALGLTWFQKIRSGFADVL